VKKISSAFVIGSQRQLRRNVATSWRFTQTFCIGYFMSCISAHAN